jgi:hypothetical protein
MTRYILSDRKQTAVTLSAKSGPGVFTVVLPVEGFTFEISDEQAETFAADLAAKVASGELLIPSAP